MYLCFSSSFICSARSWAAPLLIVDASGVAPLEAAPVVESFVRLAALLSAEPGTTRGELAILWANRRVAVSEVDERYGISAKQERSV